MPRKKKLDNATQALLEEGELLEQIVQHAGWEIVKKRLIEKIMDLQSIRNIGIVGDESDIRVELNSRNAAIDILQEWLQDIEGSVEQLKANVGENESERHDYVVSAEED